jgi:hypothetical protein
MTIRHNLEFERAVRIEMLRARAAIERDAIARRAGGLADSLDPSLALTRWLPGKSQGLVSSGFRLVSRYPYVLTALLSNRRFKAVRWMGVAALAVGAWAMFSGGGKPDGSDSDG